MINIKEDNNLNTLNHSCAHILAQAVKHLYSNAKFWVGPVVESGFYYDIDFIIPKQAAYMTAIGAAFLFQSK